MVQRPFFNFILRKCIALPYILLSYCILLVLFMFRNLPTCAARLIYLYEEVPLLLTWDLILSALYFFRRASNIFGSFLIGFTYPIFWFFAFIYQAGTFEPSRAKTIRDRPFSPESHHKIKIPLDTKIFAFPISWYLFSFYQLFNRPNFSCLPIFHLASSTTCTSYTYVIKAYNKLSGHLPEKPPDIYFLNSLVHAFAICCTFLFIFNLLWRFFRAFVRTILYFVFSNPWIVDFSSRVSRLRHFILTTQHNLPTVMIFPRPSFELFDHRRHIPRLPKSKNKPFRLKVSYSWTNYFILI